MKDDLIERLRGYYTVMRGGHPSICDEAADALEAARAEIERLPAIFQELRAALSKCDGWRPEMAMLVQRAEEAALRAKGDGK